MAELSKEQLQQLQVPKLHSWLKPPTTLVGQIQKLLHYRNKNRVIIIVGECGSGKTYFGASLGMDIDPTFDVTRIIFNSDEFLKLSEALNRGQVIMFDECGVGAGSRTYYRQEQIHLMQVLQTFRHLNLCIILTVPDFSFIDKQARKLCHVYFAMDHIDYQNKTGYANVYKLQNNPAAIFGYGAEIYKKRPIIYGKKLTLIGYQIPPDWITTPYEAKKKAFTHLLRQILLRKQQPKEYIPTVAEWRVMHPELSRDQARMDIAKMKMVARAKNAKALNSKYTKRGRNFGQL